MHASVVAHMATAHYADHQPYYRIATQLKRQGIHLPHNSQAALMVQLDATPVALLDRTRSGRVRGAD
jgi:transposase